MRKLQLCLIVFILALPAFAKLNIVTYNIRTFDSKVGMTDKVELVRILKKLDFDFLTVEEIVNAVSFEKLIRKNFPGFGVKLSQCGGAGRQKIGFIYNKKKFYLKKSYEDSRLSDPLVVDELGCGRLRPAFVGVFRDLESNKDFVMIGVHLKAGGKPRSYTQRESQYKVITKMIKEFQVKGFKNILVMGDFNTTGYSISDSDFKNFEQLLHSVNYQSSAKDIQCSSYWSGKDREDNIEESSILDHIIYPKVFLGLRRASTKVASHCRKASCMFTSGESLGVSYQKVSDHCPVITTFK